MEQELAHLKTKLSFHTSEHQGKSQEIIAAFKNACLNLDAGLFEPFMEEEDCFEDLDKYRFLDSLKSNFDRIRSYTKGEIEVTMKNTICQGCSYGKPVMSFSCCSDNGNQLIGSFGYLIDEEDGILKDIYQCNLMRLEGDGYTDQSIELLFEKARKKYSGKSTD